MTRIIIPAYNEAANLPTLVEGIGTALKYPHRSRNDPEGTPALGHPAKSRSDLLGTPALESAPYRLYIVDDGSTDETEVILNALRKTHPITLLTHRMNQGVAAAFRTGFTAVTRDAEHDDVVVLMEGDGTSPPSLLPTMIQLIQDGADLVIASRYQTGGGYVRFPLKRLILSRGANAVFRQLAPNHGVSDYSIFFRGYRVPPLRAALAAHGGQFITSETFFANIEILLKLRPYLRRAVEVPLLYDYGKKRGTSGMKIWRNLRSYLVFITRYLLRDRKRRAALR